MSIDSLLARFGITEKRVGSAYYSFVNYVEGVTELFRGSTSALAKLREICPRLDSLSDEERLIVDIAYAIALYGMCRKKAVDLDICEEVLKLGSGFYQQLLSLAMSGSYGIRRGARLKNGIERILKEAERICGLRKSLIDRIKSAFTR